MSSTIFALATAPGRAAVAVVRLSGPETTEALRALAGEPPPPREARLRRLKAPTGEILDEALVLFFPGPASYTGEDAAELHLHGGPAVVGAVTRALTALKLRPAEAGEFTRRAFEHGKLDLSQAEAIADLVDAETEGQRKQALDQLEGALSRRYEAWRGRLLEALTVLEAAVDFPDEDLPDDVAERARPHLEALRAELQAALADARRGEQVRDGLRIAIVGAPNAGKSSVLNALVRREAAIVTPTPGTTRDVIEHPLVLSGFKALLADTAGVRETSEAIEAEGVRRARAWAEGAQLRLWVVDGSVSGGAWGEASALVRDGDLLVLNKSDLPEGADAAEARAFAGPRGLQVVSARALGAGGVAALEALIDARARELLTGWEFPAVTRERHRRRLAEALDHLG
ncbi:MAG: tRNA uridine-5-carboxymethylaminomethyl(34) synthesis GTPase MnmE, partial [Caulobacteraceae bacterium]